MNCNRIEREGNCDGARWVECTYCGALDNDKCLGVKKPEPWNDTKKHLADCLNKIASNQSPQEYELVALVADLLRRIEILECSHTKKLEDL